MKIAVSASVKDLYSEMDPVFCRSKFFALYDTDKKDCSFHQNRSDGDTSQGTGANSALTILSLGAETVITEKIDGSALKVLKSSRISVFVARKSSILEAIEDFSRGSLREIEAPNV